MSSEDDGIEAEKQTAYSSIIMCTALRAMYPDIFHTSCCNDVKFLETLDNFEMVSGMTILERRKNSNFYLDLLHKVIEMEENIVDQLPPLTDAAATHTNREAAAQGGDQNSAPQSSDEDGSGDNGGSAREDIKGTHDEL